MLVYSKHHISQPPNVTYGEGTSTEGSVIVPTGIPSGQVASVPGVAGRGYSRKSGVMAGALLGLLSPLLFFVSHVGGSSDQGKQISFRTRLTELAVVVIVLGGMGSCILQSETGFLYRGNVGRTAYNATNGARRGEIVGLYKRSGVWCYQVRTESGRLTFAPASNSDVR